MALPATQPEGVVVGMTDKGIGTVRAMLDKMKSQIQMALPRHMTADRMIRVAITSVQKNDRLLQCAPVTLIGAIVQLAQLGLEPDDGTGKAYLIPFFNGQKQRYEVQAMAGYRGLVQLARNSGEVRDVIPRVVHEKDHFIYDFGTNHIEHRPYDGEGDAGKPIKYYAIANYKDGGKSFDVMTMAEILAVRDLVRSKNKGKDPKVWADFFDEMAKKTVVRRLCKHLPSSPELQRAVTLDEKADFAIPQDLGNLILPDQEKATDTIEAPAGPKRLSDTKKEEPTNPLITDEQENQLLSLCEDSGVPAKELAVFLKRDYKIDGPGEIRKGDYEAICAWVKNSPPEVPLA